MPGDKAADRCGKQHHESDRHYDGADHESNLIDHSDRCDHGVERENRVEQDDLNDHTEETCGDLLRHVTFLAFEALVYFESRFREQEQTAADENQIAARDLLTKNGEQRSSEADH